MLPSICIFKKIITKTEEKGFFFRSFFLPENNSKCFKVHIKHKNNVLAEYKYCYN